MPPAGGLWFPPTIAIAISPMIAVRIPVTHRGMVGDLSQSLNLIARNCFISTAIQKTGREKNMKATNVIE